MGVNLKWRSLLETCSNPKARRALRIIFNEKKSHTDRYKAAQSITPDQATAIVVARELYQEIIRKDIFLPSDIQYILKCRMSRGFFLLRTSGLGSSLGGNIGNGRVIYRGNRSGPD